MSICVQTLDGTAISSAGDKKRFPLLRVYSHEKIVSRNSFRRKLIRLLQTVIREVFVAAKCLRLSFLRIVNGPKALPIFAKCCALDVCLGSEYASGSFMCNFQQIP